MKKFISAASAILVLMSSVYAEEKLTCEDIASIAKSTMQLRQREHPMSNIMKSVQGEPMFEKIVLLAYSKPSFRSPEYVERAVAEFENLIYLSCLKNKKDK